MSGTKIAVIADIHANIWALNAALDDIQRQGVSNVVNLGDILYGPLKPSQTFERLNTDSIYDYDHYHRQSGPRDPRNEPSR